MIEIDGIKYPTIVSVDPLSPRMTYVNDPLLAERNPARWVCSVNAHAADIYQFFGETEDQAIAHAKLRFKLLRHGDGTPVEVKQ